MSIANEQQTTITVLLTCIYYTPWLALQSLQYHNSTVYHVHVYEIIVHASFIYLRYFTYTDVLDYLF